VGSIGEGSPALSKKKRESRKRFEAVRWTYREAVAWVCYRNPSRLLDLVCGLSRGDRWYESEKHQADNQVREAIQSGQIMAFDESGMEIKPLAVLGRDPKVFFRSDTIKARWPNAGIEKLGIGAISPQDPRTLRHQRGGRAGAERSAKATARRRHLLVAPRLRYRLSVPIRGRGSHLNHYSELRRTPMLSIYEVRI
jgi:hypothetical protein